MNVRPVIYQLLPRLFTNYNENPVPNGSILQNGSGKLNDINPTILGEIRRLGATHVWYTGVIEHAHDADYTRYGIRRHNPHIVKGKAGSPYAITDYYDIDPDLAVSVPDRMKEFEALVKRTHKAKLKVIIDFVPNHVAREYHSDVRPAGIEDLGAHDDSDMFFAPYNNFYYIPRQQFSPVGVNLGSGDDAYVEFPARATGNDCFTAFPGINDWYETVKLNYGVDYGDGSRHFDPIPDTWYKMLHILRYWASKGVDGFRCDMAHMVPLEFWNWAIKNVKSKWPDIIFIAEIYDVGLYRPYIEAGFDYLYDKVNLYDTLRGIECHNISAARLTSCWQTVEGIGPQMLNFLENHDEQRFASPQYASDPNRAIASMVVSAFMNTGATMIYAGQELGEKATEAEGFSGMDGRTTIFDYWSVPSLRKWLNHGTADGQISYAAKKLQDSYRQILTLTNKEKALREGKFFDLMYVNYQNPTLNPHKHYAFLRKADNETILVVANFNDTADEISVNIPEHAFNVLEMIPGKVTAVELLGGEKKNTVLNADMPFETHVPAHGAVAWKIKPAPKRKPTVSKKK